MRVVVKPNTHTAIKPINLVFQSGVPAAKALAVQRAIYQMLYMVGLHEKIQINNFGYWRQPGWSSNGILQEYQSVDWYIEEARRESVKPGQLNGETFIRLFMAEPWQKHERHYDVLVVNEDMYGVFKESSTGQYVPCNFIVGNALQNVGTVISLYRLSTSMANISLEMIQTVIFHEVGHVFGLPGKNRSSLDYQFGGGHCTNECVMRQGVRLPTDWEKFTLDRLRSGQVYCIECLNDLRSWFR